MYSGGLNSVYYRRHRYCAGLTLVSIVRLVAGCGPGDCIRPLIRSKDFGSSSAHTTPQDGRRISLGRRCGRRCVTKHFCFRDSVLMISFFVLKDIERNLPHMTLIRSSRPRSVDIFRPVTAVMDQRARICTMRPSLWVRFDVML